MRVHDYAADHRYLLEQAAREAGLEDPIAVNLSHFEHYLVAAATRGPVRPIDGVLVRDWNPDFRRTWMGVHVGMRVYQIQDIRFVKVRFRPHTDLEWGGLMFCAVARKDYHRLYRLGVQLRRDQGEAPLPPIMAPEKFRTLCDNTIGYLDRGKLSQIKTYGGRPKRGLLLTGPPGNGKTSACRWLWHQCLEQQWDFRLVTPDDYRAARNGCSPAEAVKELFTLDKRGIVFFDDMDIALRDRDKVNESDDQAVFLTSLDGIEITDGVVFVFTTNCSLDLIDPAFKRPGRIDLLLDFPPPTPELRAKLIERWHPDIRAALDVNRAVETTHAYSFAEIDELKNLLIMRFMDADSWNWDWALSQFALNRQEFNSGQFRRQVGFEPAPNGNGMGH